MTDVDAMQSAIALAWAKESLSANKERSDDSESQSRL